MLYRLTEQLWKKVKAYETLLLDLVPNLDSAQQSAIQRALLLVGDFVPIYYCEADTIAASKYREPPRNDIWQGESTSREQRQWSRWGIYGFRCRLNGIN